MYRRRLLALLGAATLAGCPAADDGPATASPTDGAEPARTTTAPPEGGASPTDTTPEPLELGDAYRTADGSTLTISDAHLARSVFDLVHPDAVAPLAPRNAQFVFLTIELDDADALAPSPDSLHLRIDDERIMGSGRVGDADIEFSLSVPNEFVHTTPGTADEQDFERATVGFEVPLDVDPDQVSVELHGDAGEMARWSWGDDLVRDLARPPEFRVTEIDHPDSFVCGERYLASITVANEGGRTEEFRAIFPATEPIAEEQTTGLSGPIPAGGTATLETYLEFPPPLRAEECDDDVDTATFVLDWGLDTQEITMSRRA